MSIVRNRVWLIREDIADDSHYIAIRSTFACNNNNQLIMLIVGGGEGGGGGGMYHYDTLTDADSKQ